MDQQPQHHTPEQRVLDAHATLHIAGLSYRVELMPVTQAIEHGETNTPLMPFIRSALAALHGEKAMALHSPYKSSLYSQTTLASSVTRIEEAGNSEDCNQMLRM